MVQEFSITSLTFLILFAPFIAFMLALRFIPQETRIKMFSFRIPFLDMIPVRSRPGLGGAVYMTAVFFALHSWHTLAPSWFDVFEAMIIAFCVGAAFGNWEAGKTLTVNLQTLDRSVDS